MGAAIIVIGALVLAAGVGVKVKTKWGESSRAGDADGTSRNAVLAGIAIMAVGLVVVHPWTSGDKNSPGASGSPTTSASTSASQPSAPASNQAPTTSVTTTPSTSSASPAAPFWSGSILLTDVDLDSAPATTLSANNDASVWTAEVTEKGGLIYGHNPIYTPSLASWDGPGTPTQQQCADKLSTHGVDNLPFHKGTIVCAATKENRIAVITVGSYDPNQQVFSANATVWPAAS